MVRSLRRFGTLSKYNEHVSQTKLNLFKPSVSPNAWASSSATLTGEVVLGDYTTVFPGTVIRGDLNQVVIGLNCSIMPNCSLYTTQSILSSGEISALNIETACIVMPNCTLISCTLEENCFIGSNSVICEGAIIGKGSIIGPNSIVPPSRAIPAGQVWAGNPVRFVKEVERTDWITNIGFLDGKEKLVSQFRGDDDLPSSVYLEYERIEKQVVDEIKEAEMGQKKQN